MGYGVWGQPASAEHTRNPPSRKSRDVRKAVVVPSDPCTRLPVYPLFPFRFDFFRRPLLIGTSCWCGSGAGISAAARNSWVT